MIEIIFLGFLLTPLLTNACVSPRCLLSRDDILPCQYTHENIIQAGPNEYSVHQTRIRRPLDVCICIARYQEQEKYLIPTLGTDQLRVLHSPGFSSGNKYETRVRAEYKVLCADDEMALFNITHLDLQSDQDCWNSAHYNRCQDYIQVVEPFSTHVDECGTTPSTATILQPIGGNFTVVFRSSEDAIVGGGFEMYVVCFKPAEALLKDCVDVSEFATDVCTAELSTSQTKRSLRSTENRKPMAPAFYTDFFPNSGYPSHLMMAPDLARFHKQWKSSVSTDIIFSAEIPHKYTVTYRRRTLTVWDSDNNRESSYQVNTLRTFDSNGVIMIYGRRASQRFRGPGLVKIANGNAYFQLFRYDPRGIVPNEAEEGELLLMSTPLLASLYQTSRERPRRPQRDVLNPQFSEEDREAVFAALRSKDSCNAVLRAQSRATLSFYNQTNPNFVDCLTTFNITCTLLSGNTQLMCTSDSTTLTGRTMCKIDNLSPFKCEPFRDPVPLSPTPMSTVTINAINCLGQVAMKILMI